MGINLLIADPDPKWSQDAKAFFESSIYEVYSFQNGKEVQMAIYSHKFVAAIISQSLQNHSAIQILNYIKTSRPELNVIVSLEVNTKQADIIKIEKMGFKYFIQKPFSFNDLHKMVENIQDIEEVIAHMPTREGQLDEEEVKVSDCEFTQIKIDELYSGKPVLFDIFVQLNNNHYVKILHEGDTFNIDRINKYKEDKGIEFLYFKTKDRKKYLKFTNHLVKKLAQEKIVTGKVKVSMLKTASEKFLEEICTEGMEACVLDEGVAVCQNITSVIDGEASLHLLLREFVDFDPRAVSHAFAITFFSSVILKQLKWNSKKTVDTMSLACMFHDLGKSKLSPELVEMRPQDMNPEQLAEYKTHPRLGSDLLAKEKHINSTIRQIIHQHHEYYDGSGFPGKLKGSQITNLAKIICLANDFVHVVTDNNLNPLDGVKRILSSETSVRRYDPIILETFMLAFIDPKKIAS